jgi:hypothetical protein
MTGKRAFTAAGTLIGAVLWVFLFHRATSAREVIAVAEPFVGLLLLGAAFIKMRFFPALDPSGSREQSLPRWSLLFFMVLFSLNTLGARPMEIPALETRNRQLSQTGSAIFGTIPTTDAEKYYQGACRLLTTGEIDSWNTKRPINVAWLAMRLWLADGSLELALLFQSLVVGIAAWTAARTVFNGYGPASALAFTGLIYAFSRLHSISCLSEPLGLTLGLLGVAWLVPGFREKRFGAALAGITCLFLAEGVRPGMVFVPLLLVPWLSFTFWPAFRSKTALVALSLAPLIAVSLVNRGIVSAFNSGSGAGNYNFAMTFVGLSRGTDWKEPLKAYADKVAGMSRKEEAAF